MAWTGHISDEAAAFRMAGSGRIGVNFLGMTNANFSSLAVARAAAVTANALKPIADQCIGDQCSRGFLYASNYGAAFSSTTAAFFASLPTNTHQMRGITG